MTDDDKDVIEHLNETAVRRFEQEVQLDAEKQSFKNDEAAHAGRIATIQIEIDSLDQKLQAVIKGNRTRLIERGKKSFVTMCAKFQFRGSDARTKIVDAVGIMQAARKIGVVRKVAKPTNTWKFDTKMFLTWLEKNGELRRHFEPFIEDVPAGESLSMKPNGNYTVHHDSKRISPPSVTIQKKS